MSSPLADRAHEVVAAVVAGNATPETVARFARLPVETARVALAAGVSAGLLSGSEAAYVVTPTGLDLVRRGRVDDEWDGRVRSVTARAQQRAVGEVDRERATAWVARAYADGRLDAVEAERRRTLALSTDDLGVLATVWQDLVPPPAASASVPHPGLNTWPVVRAVESGASTIGEVSVLLGRPVVSVDSAVRTLVRRGYLRATLPPDAPLEAVRLEATDLVQRAHALAARRSDSVEMWMAFTRSDHANPRADGDIGAAYERFAERWRASHPLPAAPVAPEPDDGHLLVSDDERDRTTAILGQAYAEARFDLAELERRAAEALLARDRDDIDEALDGVPLARPAAPVAPSSTASVATLLRGVQAGTQMLRLFFLVFVVGFLAVVFASLIGQGALRVS